MERGGNEGVEKAAFADGGIADKENLEGEIEVRGGGSHGELCRSVKMELKKGEMGKEREAYFIDGYGDVVSFNGHFDLD